jgi:DNA-binding response OmpR family regulator
VKPKVLIVDDDADLRRILQLAVGAAGYQAVLAADGVSALQAAQREHPAVIVLDLGLPGGDGFSVLDRLGASTTLAGIPVVVVSGRDAAGTRERALAAGAVEFLAKPIDPALFADALRRHAPQAGGTAAPAERAAPKVLLVEDDADLRQGLAARLRSKGFSPASAADATSAMTVALRERPDVILLDLGLPGGDGLLLLERLKKHPALGAVPVVVLSARDPAAHRDRALAAGAVAYLQKPADNEALVAALRAAIGPD